jgi:hypothetical protein
MIACQGFAEKISALTEVSRILTDWRLRIRRVAYFGTYPFEPFGKGSRAVSKDQAIRIHMRDGFIDRYSGQPLVFQGSLRLMSELLPAAFPYHEHWKTDECHFAYWELAPTLDHVVPVSRGGGNSDENIVTTSAVRNAAKANFTLDELGWSLKPAGDYGKWDGLVSWFVEMSGKIPSVFERNYFRRWLKIVESLQRRR